MLGTWEIILIVLVILLIFGGKKIPELMRGLGKGVKSFKDGVNGKEDEAVADEKAKNPDAKAKEEVKEEKSNEAK
ncbi:MAG: twin-arginine translocase TatA/TatE family subunit [Paludibacteraceae bacterium]|nr:twin-arginine translocase TatA/TatE family subunit [Paludibacteraceae bacterium]